MEGSCIGFWKSKANSTFCKVVKQKGEGKPTFSTRSFPLSLRPSPLPCGDQGSPPGPPMPCFAAQSFVFAVFATLICQINSVFPCKDTKLQKAALFGGSLSCGTELCFSGKGERTTRGKFCVAFCFCLVTVFMPGWKRGETVIYAPLFLGFW